MKVKICGARRPEDIAACLDAGADHIGFNFASRSTRRVTPELARRLAADLAPGVGVAVFEDADPQYILDICDRAGLGIAQVHGTLTEPAAARLADHLHLIRAVSGTDRDDQALARLAPWVVAFLFDGRRPGAGEAWATDSAVGPVRAGRPTFLAGGLRPNTVADAIAAHNPAGVDVASGVEGPDHNIDPARVNAFTRAARSAQGARL